MRNILAFVLVLLTFPDEVQLSDKIKVIGQNPQETAGASLLMLRYLHKCDVLPPTAQKKLKLLIEEGFDIHFVRFPDATGPQIICGQAMPRMRTIWINTNRQTRSCGTFHDTLEHEIFHLLGLQHRDHEQEQVFHAMLGICWDNTSDLERNRVEEIVIRDYLREDPWAFDGIDI